MTPMTLPEMGWKAVFQQQLSLDELETGYPARVAEVHRNRFVLWTEAGERSLPVTETGNAADITVGDWLLLASTGNAFLRRLQRQSVLSRKAAGEKAAVQLIAANLDTLFIVTSCNDDFNLSRIERYLALAAESRIQPVLILTKTDLCVDPSQYLQPARSLDSGLLVEPVNALDPDDVASLLPWCGGGQTVAFLGSSGVGKSTLINTLAEAGQAVAGIREQDSKGRHTTTGRTLHALTSGGVLIDTPGMRELKLFDVEEGLEEVFCEISSLASQCRFGDCRHQDEPGCAVQAAVASGEIAPRRLQNYHKVLREQARNTATLAEQRAASRETGRYIKQVLKEIRHKKGR
jgi:ribosome biogenesis GTPase